MTRALTRALLLTALLAGGIAEAQYSRPRPSRVPEFDPAAIGAVAAIVAVGGVLIARRRR